MGSNSDAMATVPARTSSVPATRAFLVALLAGWDVAPENIDDAALCVSELVANAILYGSGAVLLRVRVEHGGIHVAVTDHGKHLPHQIRADVNAEGGRGLWLVEALSVDWGCTPSDAADGKTVWFELRVLPH